MKQSLFASLSSRGLTPDEIGLRHLAPAMLGEMVLRTTVSMVNVAFLSRISDSMVSAVSISTQYINILLMIATAVATGSIVCINAVNLVGCTLVVFRPIPVPGEPVMGVAVANVAIAANALLGLAFGLLFLLFSPLFLTIMKVSPASLHMAAVYMRIVGGAMVIQCLQLVTSNICRSMGRTKIPLLVNLCINAVNLVGCALVVFRPIPVPGEPVMGVAVANVASQAVGLCLALWAMALRRRITKIALVSNVCFSLAVILLRRVLLGIFTTDSAILQIASTVVVIDLFVEIGRALNNTLSGALQATGDVMYQLVVNQSSNWLVSVALSYLFGIVLGYGLNGIWVAFALDEAVRGLILLRRWNSKKWMEKAEKRRLQVAGSS